MACVPSFRPVKDSEAGVYSMEYDAKADWVAGLSDGKGSLQKEKAVRWERWSRLFKKAFTPEGSKYTTLRRIKKKKLELRTKRSVVKQRN